MKEAIKDHMEGRQVNKDELILRGFIVDHLSHSEKPCVAGEIVEYQGKNYKLVTTAESLKGLSQYSMVYSMLVSQGIDWFVVEDFTSEKHKTPVAAIFVELSNQKPDGMVKDYRAAIDKITSMEE